MSASDLRRRMNENPRAAMLALGALVLVVGLVTQARLTDALMDVRKSARLAANLAAPPPREDRSQTKSASRALSDLQTTLEQLAAAARIALDSTEPLGAEPIEGEARVGLRVQFSGSYASAVEFISRVTQQRDLVCGTISIRRQAGEEAETAATITVYAMFAPEGALSEAPNVR
jgi:hypothetical protein